MVVQNQAMPVEGSDTRRRALMSSRGKLLSNSFDRQGVNGAYYICSCHCLIPKCLSLFR